MTEQFDAIVIGAGHAGCEAALALARLSCKTALFTVSVDSIAMMPCNPNVGGTSKGHLVREIDALGGEMGKNIDRTFIQSKMLNQSKGPAVHSLRAQADKKEYSYAMRKVIEETDGVSIKQGEITDIIVEDGKVYGVKSYTGAIYPCKVVVLCTGTYLNARCITGETSVYTGPNGLQSATHLTDSLKKLGISMRRFKTGTPARMDGRTIDYSKMEPQYGDEKIVPFSFENKPEDLEREQVKCWLTYTNEETHKVIRENLDRSPLYSGYIKGTGPRYCPSIEDKVVRFADKNRHQVFIEPEGNYTNEMYVGGMSSSLPEDVQYEMYRTVKGLENVKIIRNAYAIEYDCINPNQLKLSLEFRNIQGLFSGGQFNGSSGYEEAAWRPVYCRPPQGENCRCGSQEAGNSADADSDAGHPLVARGDVHVPDDGDVSDELPHHHPQQLYPCGRAAAGQRGHSTAALRPDGAVHRDFPADASAVGADAPVRVLPRVRLRVQPLHHRQLHQRGV